MDLSHLKSQLIHKLKNLDAIKSRFIRHVLPHIFPPLIGFGIPIQHPPYSLCQIQPYSISFPEKEKMKNDTSFSRSQESFSAIHKLPTGDTPYVRAKYYQMVEKDPEAAIVEFWNAIYSGDRVDSALKDMAVVMKQQNKAEEAIKAINSFRHICSIQAQESLDNVLIDLYKKCGKLEEQIELLKQKLRMICQGDVFNGRPSKTARSHGKKFQITVQQETSRILGNLGWTYMQLKNYSAAEAVYQKAQEIDPDSNKACNLCLCLLKQERYFEARNVLQAVLQGKYPGSDDPKSRNRALSLLQEVDSLNPARCDDVPYSGKSLEDAFICSLDQLMNNWTPVRSRRLPIFEQIISQRNQLAC